MTYGVKRLADLIDRLPLPATALDVRCARCGAPCIADAGALAVARQAFANLTIMCLACVASTTPDDAVRVQLPFMSDPKGTV